MENKQGDHEILRFILEKIDSVSQLEGLLLLWRSRPTPWTIAELSQRLYVEPEVGREIVFDLVRKQLISPVGEGAESYRYRSDSEEQDRLIGRVDETYRREIVRISTMIHSKPSSAVRDFARAFRFTKEKD